MEGMKKALREYPVAVSAVVTLGLIWAYHNGHLGTLISGNSKVPTQAADSKSTTSTSNS